MILFVFENRVEIINPGHLPNHLTIEKIRAGNSVQRNPVLASFAAKRTASLSRTRNWSVAGLAGLAADPIHRRSRRLPFYLPSRALDSSNLLD